MYTPTAEESAPKAAHKSVKTDLYSHHDYYGVDDLLEDDHKMARGAVQEWVKAEVSPIIEDCLLYTSPSPRDS